MKKLLSLTAFIACASFVFVFSGCGDDEASASMTLTLDGEKMKIRSVTGILIYGEESGHESRGLNLTGLLSNNDMITIQITNWDFQNPPKDGFVKKKYYNVFDGEEAIEQAECLDLGDVNLCDNATITYLPESGDIYTSAFDEEIAGFLEVTSSKGRKISGNFDVVVTNFSEEGSDIRATGTFKNVGYRIVSGI